MLTEISVGFDNPDEFVGSLLFPAVRVAKQSDKYFVYNRDLWGRVTDDFRAPGARANELPPMTLSRETYFAEEHALVDVVPEEEVQNADAPLQPATDATQRLTNTILLNRENSIVALATTAANYASGFSATLSGTQQWNDYTNSDPVGDLKAGRNKIHDSIFRDPNLVIMGYQVATKLEDHPDFIERIKYSQVGITTDELIARVIGVPRIARAGAGKVTSAYGATETFGYLWGKDVVMAFVPPRPGVKTPSFGYEFVWTYPGAGVQATERWHDDDRAADVIRVRRRYDVKMITVDATGDMNAAGYLVKNAIA
jgi:hypothetical protein